MPSSGGKDSLHNLTYCVALGHEPVAVANLHPREAEEIDSFCFQSVGHALIPQLAEALGLPLYRQPITGEAKAQGRTYRATDGDEVCCSLCNTSISWRTPRPQPPLPPLLDVRSKTWLCCWRG